ncbi:MAG: DUF1631 domain-containing protein [Lysobacterales bacterium]
MEANGSSLDPTASARPLPRSLRESGLAPRARTALDGVFAYLAETLEKALRHTLNEFEQALFKLAEQSRSNEEQQRCFESLREIRRGRADLAPRFMVNLETALAVSGRATANSEVKTDNRARMGLSLSLVDNTELEDSLVLTEAASRAETSCGPILQTIGQRIAVLVAAPAFEPEELPIGPRRMGECLRQAAEEFSLPPEHRQLLFRLFGRHVLQEMQPHYEHSNQFLIESGILPNLQASSPRLRRVGGSGAGAATGKSKSAAEEAVSPAASESAAEDTPTTDNSPAPAWSGSPAQTVGGAGPPAPPGARQAYIPPPAGPAASHGAQSPSFGFGGSSPGALNEELMVAGFGQPLTTGWPSMPQPVAREPAANDVQDRQMFNTLRGLLAGRRDTLGLGGTQVPVGNAHEVPSSEVQSILARLQSMPSTVTTVGGKAVPRNVTQIKQDLLNQLRQVTPEGKLPRLAEEDTDTLDLVGMLFDNLTREERSVAPVQDLLMKMQVPMMRVALADKSFFSRRSHPARQLVNALAEGSFYYVGDESQDRGLSEKMQSVVDRINADYVDDLNLFEDLLQDFARHLHSLVRKAEVTEKRQVESVQGREKLEHARKLATAAIAGRLAQYKPRALIRTLLEQAWADVLALTILRSGEHSDAYQRRLAVIDRLIETDRARSQGNEAFAPAAETSPSTVQAAEAASAETPELRAEVESGLSQVGFHLDDVQSVIARLFDEERANQSDDTATLTEVAQRLRAKTRFGEDSGEGRERPGLTRPDLSEPLTPAQLRIVEELKGVPYGTWFEMLASNGDWQPRKLSWFSPLSGRCLFVNQRGARAEEMSMETLAREIGSKRARLMPAKTESLIDRAWSAIQKSLKSLTGGSEASVASP